MSQPGENGPHEPPRKRDRIRDALKSAVHPQKLSGDDSDSEEEDSGIEIAVTSRTSASMSRDQQAPAAAATSAPVPVPLVASAPPPQKPQAHSQSLGSTGSAAVPSLPSKSPAAVARSSPAPAPALSPATPQTARPRSGSPSDAHFGSHGNRPDTNGNGGSLFKVRSEISLSRRQSKKQSSAATSSGGGGGGLSRLFSRSSSFAQMARTPQSPQARPVTGSPVLSGIEDDTGGRRPVSKAPTAPQLGASLHQISVPNGNRPLQAAGDTSPISSSAPSSRTHSRHHSPTSSDAGKHHFSLHRIAKQLSSSQTNTVGESDDSTSSFRDKLRRHPTTDNFFSPSQFLPQDMCKKSWALSSNYTTHHKNIIKSRTIGKGATAVVKTAQSLKTKEVFAVKVYHRTSPFPKQSLSNYYAMLAREYVMTKNLHHRNVVATLDLCVDGDAWCTVMEYCDGGDLFSLLAAYKAENKRMSREERNCLFKQLLMGTAYLHQNGVAHRDIKPENLLMSKDGMKISDFGVSEAIFDRRTVERDENGEPLAIKLSTGVNGSEPYIAPEVYEGKKTGTRYDARLVDTWACALVYVNLLYNGNLFTKAVAETDQGYDRLQSEISKYWSSELGLEKFLQSVSEETHSTAPSVAPSAANSASASELPSMNPSPVLSPVIAVRHLTATITEHDHDHDPEEECQDCKDAKDPAKDRQKGQENSSDESSQSPITPTSPHVPGIESSLRATQLSDSKPNSPILPEPEARSTNLSDSKSSISQLSDSKSASTEQSQDQNLSLPTREDFMNSDKKQPLAIFNDFGEGGKKLVARMLNPDPSKRPQVSELVKTRFVKRIGMCIGPDPSEELEDSKLDVSDPSSLRKMKGEHVYRNHKHAPPPKPQKNVMPMGQLKDPYK